MLNFASFLSIFYVLFAKGDAVTVISPEIQAKIDEHRARKPQVYFDISIDGKPMGKIVFTLYWDDQPRTAENFYEIATGENGLGYSYKDTIFHRIIPQFMVQGGDFTKYNGTGGKSIYGEKFDDEEFKRNFDKEGLLGMANSGPNTNGSQFFITTSLPHYLDGKHIVFGEVSKGYNEVVKLIESQGTGGGKPKGKVTITACGKYEETSGLDHVEG